MKPLSPESVAAFLSRVPNAIEREPMEKHTSFHIGGPARLYVVAGTSDEILSTIVAAYELSIPWFVYGGGTNLLVADEGYEGVVIQAAGRGLSIEGNIVKVESGVISALVARKVTDAGLAGFEWAVGLPGTIGGAVFGNAGCFGGETGDAIVAVDAYRVKDKQRVRLTKAECQFGYRESMFKHEPHVILSAEFQFATATDPAASKAKMQEILSKRKGDQPLGQSSAGCIFKNFDFRDEHELEILKRQMEVPAEMLSSKRIPAGWLIDKGLGLLGYKMGTASVSDKHGNFLVNAEHAKAQDVIALVSFLKMKVRDELGIELQEEVQLLGF